MKKTLLLSLATATALTFGASSLSAKAESLQPTNQPSVTYSSPYQFLSQPMSQQNFQTLLDQLFGKQFAKIIAFQPGNCNLTYAAPTQTQTTQAAPAQTQTTQAAPAQTQTTQAAPAQKQTTQAAPAQTQTTQAAPAQTQTTQAAPAQTQTAKPATTQAQPTQSTPAQTQTTKPASTSTQTQSGVLSAYEQKVVDLTNAERAKAGLPALKVDTTLSKVAKAKSQDMNNLNYFDHTSPTYGSPFDMMKQFGITYTTAGENIAEGQATPDEVVQAWMASPGHRANILNNTYTYIGVGYVSGKNIWTQEFISK